MLIYCTGYSGTKTDKGVPKVSALRELVKALDARLVDIRFSPTSIAPYWRKHNLAKIFGARYLHVREWGNEAYREKGAIRLVDWAAGARIVLALKRTPLLLCGCEKFEGCHREVIANALVQMGHQVVEIPNWSVFLETRG